MYSKSEVIHASFFCITFKLRIQTYKYIHNTSRCIYKHGISKYRINENLVVKKKAPKRVNV